MAIVVHLVRRIDPHRRGEVLDVAGLVRRRHLDLLRRAVAEADDVVGLVAGEPERLRRRAVRELQRQHAHADEIGAVDALVALGDDGAHAEQARALGGPVARRARAVLLAGDHDRRHAVGEVAHRRVVDAHLLAARLVQGDPALGTGRHKVAQADVGEGAAHHHLVVAAARAVGIEIRGRDAVRLQVLAGRAVRLDGAGGRDVVGGDRVAEHREHPRAVDVRDRCRRERTCR